MVKGPSVAVEAPRPLHRALATLQRERPRPRSKGVLRPPGVRLVSVHTRPAQLEARRRWDGAPVPPGRRRRLLRVETHSTCLGQPMAALAAARRAIGRASQAAHLEQGRPVMPRKGIGIKGAWLGVRACVGWRDWQNRRQGGSFAGGTPTPYHSGERPREPGSPKAGNRRRRWRAPELAWGWGRSQPARARRRWGKDRFAAGGKRLRRMGMVAVARQFLLALWRFLRTGVCPAGAGRKAAYAIGPRVGTPQPCGGWRRPGVLPGLGNTPSESWGRLPEGFRLSSNDAPRIGDGRLRPHGEKVVGGDTPQRDR